MQSSNASVDKSQQELFDYYKKNRQPTTKQTYQQQQPNHKQQSYPYQPPQQQSQPQRLGNDSPIRRQPNTASNGYHHHPVPGDTTPKKKRAMMDQVVDFFLGKSDTPPENMNPNYYPSQQQQQQHQHHHQHHQHNNESNPTVNQHVYAPTPQQVQQQLNQPSTSRTKKNHQTSTQSKLNTSLSSLIPQGVKQSFHPFSSGLPKHFDKMLSHANNQFSYGGTNSCTYCSLEAALYALSGKICPEKVSDDVTRTFVDDILRSGVSLDLKLGVRSTDEVIPLIPRFSRHVGQPWICLGQLAIANCFDIALTSMEKRAAAQQLTSACAILTKPPESIMVYYRQPSPQIQYPYIIFDSHPRGWKQAKGAAFYCFTSRAAAIRHLQLLYKPIFENIPQHAKTYEQIKYDMFELNVLCELLNPPIEFNVPAMKTVSERTKEAAQKAHLLQSTHLSSAAQRSTNYSPTDALLQGSLSSFSPLGRSIRPLQPTSSQVPTNRALKQPSTSPSKQSSPSTPPKSSPAQKQPQSKPQAPPQQLPVVETDPVPCSDDELLPIPHDPALSSPSSPLPSSSSSMAAYARLATLESEVAQLKKQLASQSSELVTTKSKLESAYLENRSLRQQLESYSSS